MWIMIVKGIWNPKKKRVSGVSSGSAYDVRCGVGAHVKIAYSVYFFFASHFSRHSWSAVRPCTFIVSEVVFGVVQSPVTSWRKVSLLDPQQHAFCPLTCFRYRGCNSLSVSSLVIPSNNERAIYIRRLLWQFVRFSSPQPSEFTPSNSEAIISVIFLSEIFERNENVY